MKFFLCIFIWVVLLVNPPSLFAQSPSGGLTVSPAYLDVTLDEDAAEKSIELKYTNSSPVQLSLELFPIDFKQQSDHGGISFLGNDAKSYSYSLSSFLTFESDTLLLEPGETRTFTVTVKNRQDLSPGGHYAAVVARLVGEEKTTTSVAHALSALIYMRKTGGERFSISIERADWPKFPVVFSFPEVVDLTFQNIGNIHVIPYGRAEIRDVFGRVIYKGVLNTSSAFVMPETRRLIPVRFSKIGVNFPLGLYVLSINGSDSLKKTSYVYNETFFYVHPFAALGLPVALIGIVVLVKRGKRKGRK